MVQEETMMYQSLKKERYPEKKVGDCQAAGWRPTVAHPLSSLQTAMS